MLISHRAISKRFSFNPRPPLLHLNVIHKMQRRNRPSATAQSVPRWTQQVMTTERDTKVCVLLVCLFLENISYSTLSTIHAVG